MFVSMKEMLLHAHENQYAVMAVNCVNMEQVKACVESAEEEHSPIILNISPRQMREHGHSDVLLPMASSLAARASVPVAFNLDHGAAYQDFVTALEAGFSSVMIDASACEFEENIRRTQMITALAHACGKSCEAELGHVGNADVGDNANEDFYTSPEQAREFVERTHCDCLAVAIGTAHGSYPKGMIPRLDFDRLALLKKTLNMPLVLHGGSGAGEENICKAVAGGINKINVNTDVMTHAVEEMKQALKENPDYNYMDLAMRTENAMKDFIKSYMRMIDSSMRYTFETTGGAEFD